MKRRAFLQSGSAGVASLIASTTSSYASYDDKYAHRNLRVGLIGAGWQGKVDLLRLVQVAPVNVVSICDVNREMMDKASSLIASRQVSRKEPRKYNDYREMLAAKDLDAVIIGTPDHWHALQMIDAVNAGLDVFVQKPIGVDVLECQAMLSAARKTKKVVQIGMQRRSTEHLIKVKKEIIDSGMLGPVGQVDIFTYYGGSRDFYQDVTTPPTGFDYEMWTGPAPKLPFRPTFMNGGWRYFRQFANGYVGDMGVHMFDMTRWFLNLGWPKRITSVGGIYIKKKSMSNTPDTQTVIFDYDDLQVIWNHRNWTEVTDKKYPWGGFFYGKNGLLKASVFGYDFKKYWSKESLSGDVVYELEQFPEDKTEPRLEKHAAPAVRSLMKNWLDCIADRSRPVSDIEEGMISTVCCILGNISMELKRSLEWDPVAGKVKNDDEANALLARTYRAPWIHPRMV
ncbi:MAG: Gfo/Idh/MocA family oxidoreductase [Planctomycetia bacterium]|nr:Gfo/Idh/MocA family oxidoreductase [Planctomycetia bacterium]